MIYIFEDTKRQLSGITSLFIGFEYNQDLVNIVKSSGIAKYDKESHLWEVPLTSLAYLLDNLTFYDDITLIVNDEPENKNQVEPVLNYKTKPFDYQMDGIKWMLNNERGFLLDAPGLGKTLQVIYTAEELRAKGLIDHCLIVCGIASLRDNWRKEIKKHSSLDCTIIGEHITKNNTRSWNSIPKRVEQLMNPINEFFIIINVESLGDDRIIEAFKNGPNKIGFIVLDEAHMCKGWNSHRGLNLLELDSERKMALTGSLIMNNPLDAFIPLAWLGFEQKSKRKGKSGITKFKEMFCIMDPDLNHRVVGFRNLDVLQQEIMTHALRRTKDLLQLPEKNIINEYLTMDEGQEKFYDILADSVKRNSSNKEKAIQMCDKIELDNSNLLAIITRLRQATTCPLNLTSLNITSVKLERAVELTNEIVSSGEKVVIFSSFKEPLYELEKRLKEYKPLIGTGDISDQEFSDNIDKFQNNPENKVFLGTLSKCGTGITLTSASYMIMLDEPWTYALYLQACDRIHRIGTKKPVFIYNLICEGTIDAKIAEIIDQKRALSDYIIDDIDDSETMNILQQFVYDL